MFFVILVLRLRKKKALEKALLDLRNVKKGAFKEYTSRCEEVGNGLGKLFNFFVILVSLLDVNEGKVRLV